MKDDLGRLVLRVTVGGLMVFHGVSKLGHGIGGIVTNVVNHGLPTLFAYGVYVGEVVAPILVVIGLFTRPAAVVIAFTMIVAVWLAHAGDVFALGKGGGWALELQAFYALTAVVVALLGAGRFSVRRGKSRWD